MDKLIEALADALRREFPFMDGPKTAPDAWKKAATGVVEKMGLVHYTMQFTATEPPLVWEVFALPKKED